jgi:hypothetical protein
VHDLYDDDILAWSEQQAENLCRRAANSLDWDNLAEEIEDAGRSRLRAVESHLVQALPHWLKAAAWPSARDVPHWRAQIRGQRDDARVTFAPSMTQRLDKEALYRRALRRLSEVNDGVPPQALPDHCPFSQDALLDDGDLGGPS